VPKNDISKESLEPKINEKVKQSNIFERNGELDKAV